MGSNITQKGCTRCVQKSNEELLKKTLFLVPYIPYQVIRQAGEGECCFFEKTVVPFRGSILFADIIGFTPLVASLRRMGSEGTEKLQEVLTDYYTDLIETIRNFGGSVYQFAGDSILSSFPPDDNEDDITNIRRAITCTQTIIKNLSRFTNIEILDKSYSIDASLGLGFGDYNQVLLGDKDLWCTFSIVGNPIQDAIKAERAAGKGEVAVNSALWDLMSSTLTGEQREDCYIISSQKEPLSGYRNKFNILDMIKNDRFYKRCTSLIKPVLVEKITSSYQAFQGEHRELSCLFIRFDGLHYDNDIEAATASLNDFYAFVQGEADRYGGILLHTDLSDKGNVFVIIFGAPKAQENKEILSVQLAMNIIKRKEDYPFINTIQAGISTGKAYCGNFGASIRKDYSVLGAVVNMAARLMTYSGETGLYIDLATEEKAAGNFLMDRIENISFKGMSEVTVIFKVTSGTKQQKDKTYIRSDSFIGRTKELNHLKELLNDVNNGQSRMCAITGDAGIGKSRLLDELIKEAEVHKIEPLRGACFSYEQSTPLYPWRELLLSFFKIPDPDNINESIEILQQSFESAFGEENNEWIPVLAKTIGIQAEEGEVTQQLDGRQKQHRVFELIYALLLKASEAGTLIILFEDAHSIDETSLLLLEYIADRILDARIMLLISSRTEEVLQKFEGLKIYHPIRLSQLTEDDTRSLIRAKLDFERPHTLLEEQIISSSGNNPFFVETIIQSLIDRAQIAKDEDGKMRFKGNIDNITIPNSIQDMVLSRIDTLKQDDQVVVKTASVIGHMFDSEILGSMLPEDFSQNLVNSSISTLQGMNITSVEQDNPDNYYFKQSAIRDVVYETLLEKTREELHLILALYLEKKNIDNPNSVAERLAYHFIHGKEFEKGFNFSLISAEKARDQFANNDAIKHYKAALYVIPETVTGWKQQDLIYQIKTDLAGVLRLAGNYDEAEKLYLECFSYWKTPEKKIDLYMGLGNVYQEIGDPKRAIQELEKGLKVLKRRTPGGLVSTIFALLGQMWVQLMHKMFPFFIRSVTSEKKREQFQKQLVTFRILNKIYIFDIVEKVAWSCFAIYNTAQRLKTDYDMSLACGDYAIALMGMGFLDKSFRHFKRSVELGQQSSHQQAEAIALLRLGFYYMFSNQLSEAVSTLQESIAIFRKIGEMWELLTALGSLGQAYFLMSNFEESEKAYSEVGDLAAELNSAMHLGWMYCKVPFCRYLTGKIDGETAKESLSVAINISKKAQDLMNLCIVYGHLANIAVREGNHEEAAEYSIEIMKANNNYKVIVPHVKISFVDASDAALFALENKATSVPEKRLINIARVGGEKALSMGKKFPYLKGPAHRAIAGYKFFAKKQKKAETELEKSIHILENTQNRWETGIAYNDAATLIPSKKDEYRAKAKKIFGEYNLSAELDRLKE
ncbi:MAG: tetratricopeptide repeat protein [bacterium]|nr:tetratricopeptide repeat protein [bacterium]